MKRNRKSRPAFRHETAAADVQSPEPTYTDLGDDGQDLSRSADKDSANPAAHAESVFDSCTPVLPEPSQSATTISAPSTYVISSLTLAQAHAAMVPNRGSSWPQSEYMLAVTGTNLAGVRTLEHLIDVRLAVQSPVSAAFDANDFARVLMALHGHGQALHAIFHTHPFAGPPEPSSVDWRLQRLLDQGGYPAIQAVFSSDGYVRFFANREFVVLVSGKGVEHVGNDSLFRLLDFAALPYPQIAGNSRRGRFALRPF